MEKKMKIRVVPHAKERPQGRVMKNKAGKYFCQMYTPPATKQYEKLIADAWKKSQGAEPFTTPVNVKIVFGMPIPKTTPKKTKEEMLARKVRPVTKPDVDNLAKSIMDALNGIAYKDDNQIVGMTVRKYYLEEPCVMISVKEWDPSMEVPVT